MGDVPGTRCKEVRDTLEVVEGWFYAIAHEYEDILFDMSHEFSQNRYIPWF